LSPAFIGLSVGYWIMIVACAASSGCRAPGGKMGRCAGLHRARLSPWRVWCPFSERTSAGVLRRELANKKRRRFCLESELYVQSEKAPVSPLRAFATPGDSEMLESCPFRLPANREGTRLRRRGISTNSCSEPFFSSASFYLLDAESRPAVITVVHIVAPCTSGAAGITELATAAFR
jgi:hypothetical protein